ncbi:eukaryotic translation initiation factor eIF2A-domain-containing protein [Hyaloraphidium curvatum]|nr:eukaryotic translation initiation factor eIF2A-domain-containing protein [Hyaloraphidium curvatum]
MAASQFTYRSIAGLTVTTGPPTVGIASDFERPTGNIRTFEYSPDGSLLAWTSAETVRIVNAQSGEHVRDLTTKGVMTIGFSPNGTFVSTWERYVKPEDETAQHRNLIVWRVSTGEQVLSFTMKQQQLNWNVKWTDDERFCGRLQTGEVQIYDASDFAKGVHSRLKLEGITDFGISPGANPHVAAFVGEKKGQPASIALYSLTNFAAPVSRKTFFKAEKSQMFWNQLGTGLLLLTQTEVSQGSYYGDTALYYLATAGNFDCRVSLDEDGPVHDVAWSPNSKEFIVIYGKMPAKTTLFDHRAEPIFNFPRNHRNFVRFNPQGRIICTAGFGNLAGDMDFWDRSTLTKICTVHCPNATFAEWCPNGRHLLTATLTPRLRVDNGFRVWHYRGVVVHKEDVNELYGIEWRPVKKVEAWPEKRELSPAPVGLEAAASGEAPAPKKPAGRYVPPGMRMAQANGAAPPQSPSSPKGDEALPGLAGLEARLTRQGVLGAQDPSLVPGLPPGYQKTVPGAPDQQTKAQKKNQKKHAHAKTGAAPGQDGKPPAADGAQGTTGAADANASAGARLLALVQSGQQLPQMTQEQYLAYQQQQYANMYGAGQPYGPQVFAVPGAPQQYYVQHQGQFYMTQPGWVPENHVTAASSGYPNQQATPAPAAPVGAAAPADGNFPESERQKRLRTLQKKIREIDELKQKVASGQKLELTQIKKIDREKEFQKELQDLMGGMAI